MRGIAFFLVSVYRHQATHSLACSHICLPKTCFFQSLSCLKLQGCLLLLRRVQTPGIRRSPCLSPTFCLFPYLSLHPTQYPPSFWAAPSLSEVLPVWEPVGGLYPVPLLRCSALRAGLLSFPFYLSNLPSQAQLKSFLLQLTFVTLLDQEWHIGRLIYDRVLAVEHSPRARVCSQGKSAMICCGSCRGHRGESDRMCVTSFPSRPRTFLLDTWCPAAQPLATRAYLSVN